MAFMLLIVEPNGQRLERTPEQARVAYDTMQDYRESLRRQGVLVAADSLKTGAVRVQKRNGQARLVDGPYAEAKELVGGYFLVDCATREEAVALANACPAAEWASVDVREIAPCYET
jgi:hypothetical protein